MMRTSSVSSQVLAVPAVNPSNGNLYAVYQDSIYRSDKLSQISLVASYDGGYSWSRPIRINKTPHDALNPQAFTPFVAVSDSGFVGILYTDFRFDTCDVKITNNPSRSDPNKQTLTNTWLAIYKETNNNDINDCNDCNNCNNFNNYNNVRLEFISEIRLSSNSYIAENGPKTSQGIMTNGDYSFLTALCDKFYAIYTKPFNGPFTPVENNIDDNHRQNAFVSIVKIDC